MTLIGHPFDTLKTRMQVGGASSTLQVLRQTVAQEGVLAVYKGLQPALLTTCMTSGLRFGVQHWFNSLLVKRLHSSSGSPTRASHDQLPVGTRVVAEAGGGAACGAVLPLIFTPMELVKVRRQVLRDNATSNWQIALSIWRERGLAGLYTGHRFTVARSTAGNATLFGSYEAWKALLRSSEDAGAAIGGGAGGRGDARPWTSSLLAGILSGWTTQLVTFPIDSAKSRIQAASASAATVGGGGVALPGGAGSAGGGPGGVHNLLPTLAALFREGAAYRGVSSMLVRAVPVHVAYLPVYGLLMATLSPAS